MSDSTLDRTEGQLMTSSKATPAVHLNKMFDNRTDTPDGWTSRSRAERVFQNSSSGIEVGGVVHTSGEKRIMLRANYFLPGYDVGHLDLFLSEGETDGLIRHLITHLAQLRSGVSA